MLAWYILGIFALCITPAIVITHLVLSRRRRRHAERSLAEQLDFESLISKLGPLLGELDAAMLNEQIEQWLPSLAQATNADRCALVDLSRDKTGFRTICTGAIEGIEQLRDDRYARSFPWCAKELLAGRVVQFAERNELPNEAEVDTRSFAKDGVKSHLALPLTIGGSLLDVLTFDRVSKAAAWTESAVRRALLLGDILANALERRRADSELRGARAKINKLEQRLERENTCLRKEAKLNYTYEHIIGESETIKRTLSLVEQVAATEATVLLLGETGTGKDLLADTVHRLSDRRDRPMVRVNCAALPPTLIESELFGREKGAYTGAQEKQAGRFEHADGATIFLDEVAELPLPLQAKFLRVLQDGAFERLGNPTTIHVDVRVIAATNRDLAEAVREGRFRQDLYYRLNVFPITVPPLRKRGDDIELLIWAFVEEFAKRHGKAITAIRKQDMDALRRYPWPGNVRELKNVVARAVIITTGSNLRIDSLQAVPTQEAKSLELRDVQRAHLLDVLELTGWRVRGQAGAAEILGLKPSTLESKMGKLEIRRPPKLHEIPD